MAEIDVTKQISFPAAFSQEDAFRIEAEYEGNWGVSRRLMLMMLTQSSDDLMTKFSGDEAVNALLEASEQISAFSKHLHDIAASADTVVARLLSIADQLHSHQLH